MLRCVSRYENKSRGWAWEPGDVVAGLDAATEEWLCRDAPGSFLPYIEAPPDGPPVDKRQRRETVKSPGQVMDTRSMRGLVRD